MESDDLLPAVIAEADAHIFFCREHLRPLYEKEVLPAFDLSDPANTTRNSTFAALLWRIRGWLHTISQLRELQDIQVFSAAARAIAESVVDIVLIHDGKNEALIKMVIWEQSAKLKAAQKHKLYCEELGEPMLPAAQEFLERRADTVFERRKEILGVPGHPPRWTGRSFEDDLRAADGLATGIGLKEFFGNSYLWITFSTHGSGLVAVRSVPPGTIPALAVKALPYISSFGTAAVRLALEGCALWTDRWAERMEKLQLDRDRSTVGIYLKRGVISAQPGPKPD